jgi:hypothetical protein
MGKYLQNPCTILGAAMVNRRHDMVKFGTDHKVLTFGKFASAREAAEKRGAEWKFLPERSRVGRPASGKQLEANSLPLSPQLR